MLLHAYDYFLRTPRVLSLDSHVRKAHVHVLEFSVVTTLTAARKGPPLVLCKVSEGIVTWGQQAAVWASLRLPAAYWQRWHL